PLTALLEAKLALYHGQLQRVRALLTGMREREAEARDRGEADALLVPAEEVVWSMLDLATGDGGDEAWDDLESQAQRFSQGYEQIELVEARAVWMARHARKAEARAQMERAVDMAARIPNALGPRLGRRLRELS